MANDRLKKQVDELTLKTKELSEELKHANEQLKLAASSQPQQQVIQKKDNSQQRTQAQNSRYTFGQQEQIQQQLQQSQPKGILKNKNEGGLGLSSPVKSEDQD